VATHPTSGMSPQCQSASSQGEVLCGD